MTHVVLFSFDYAPLDGGIARLCTELQRGLVEQDVRVSVLTARHDVSETQPDVKRLRGKRALREARAVHHLRLLPRHTLVLCGRWYPEGLLALLSGQRNVVILAHGAELLAARVATLASARAWVRRRVLQTARLVVANSSYTEQLVLQVAPGARTAALPLGVDINAFCPGDVKVARQRLGIHSRFVVSTVARVHPFKGHDTVIAALARLPPELRREFTYYIGGRGAYANTLRDMAGKLDLASQVVFAGLVPESALADVYRASDLFCLMTRSEARAVEGFGLALLEAQSCGVPVLGSNTGGIPDAVADGKTGFLLPADDVVGVANHLSRLTEDPEYYRGIGRAARIRAVNECSWNGYTRRLLEVLQTTRPRPTGAAADRGK